MHNYLPDFDDLRAARRYRVTIRLEPISAPVGEDLGVPFTVTAENAHALFSGRVSRDEEVLGLDHPDMIAPQPPDIALDFHILPRRDTTTGVAYRLIEDEEGTDYGSHQ
jgi:hypothetical protein